MPLNRPPCWPKDRTKPTPCALAHYACVVDGHTDLTADATHHEKRFGSSW